MASKFYLQEKLSKLSFGNPSSLDFPKGVMYMCMKGNMHIFVELSPLFTHKFVDVLQVLGYPSKPIGLFIKKCIIFQSDSNGEDLKGYIGAGLYYR